MNKIKTLILVVGIFLSGNNLKAQDLPIKIDPDTYVEAFSKFDIEDLTADTVLFTKLGKRSDSYEISKEKISKYLKSEYADKQSRFELHTSANSGMAFVISQYSKSSRIPIRFFTVFLSYDGSRKIVVIEVEENK